MLTFSPVSSDVRLFWSWGSDTRSPVSRKYRNEYASMYSSRPPDLPSVPAHFLRANPFPAFTHTWRLKRQKFSAAAASSSVPLASSALIAAKLR